jgi:hypothetical protein
MLSGRVEWEKSFDSGKFERYGRVLSHPQSFMRRGLTIKAIRNLLLGTLNDLDYTIRGTSKHSIVDVCFMAGQYGPGCHSGVGRSPLG